MGAKTKSWIFHMILAGLAAGFGSLAHATAEGNHLSQQDLFIAGQTMLAYLAGALLRSPLDARDPGTQTRASDRTDG